MYSNNVKRLNNVYCIILTHTNYYNNAKHIEIIRNVYTLLIIIVIRTLLTFKQVDSKYLDRKVNQC